MKAILEKLAETKKKYEELAEELAQPEILNDKARYAELSRQFAELSELNSLYEEMKLIEQDIERLKKDKEELKEKELIELVEEELEKQTQRRNRILSSLMEKLSPADPNDRKDVFLEIRAGAGGDESALFAGELLRMYTRFAEKMNWKTELVSANEIGIGGVKEAILSVKGKNVFSWLKYESGVHRVQRIPVTESGGRIHTSTVTVAVLPEAEKVEVELDEKDLRIDTFRASSAGGQHVNKTSSAVRITHLPTGIVVTCQDERSQFQNKDKALRVLAAHLLRLEQEKVRSKLDESRRKQVGTGERSEKIRTYNFPQDRVTDHRLQMNFHNIEKIMDGEILPILEKLKEKETAERLAELGEG